MAQDQVGVKKDQEALTQDEIVVEGARSIQKPTPIGISFLEKRKQSNVKITFPLLFESRRRERHSIGVQTESRVLASVARRVDLINSLTT